MPLTPLQSLSHPSLAPYANQPEHWLRAKHRPWLTNEPPHPHPTGTGLDPAVDPNGNLFIAEGDKLVAQLLESPHTTESLLVADTRVEIHRSVIDRVPADVPIYVLPRDLVSELAGFQIHRGLMALGRYHPPGDLDDILARAPACVICEELANHDNIGGIFRSVRALAPPATCVLLSPRCCDPLYRKALRVSMGNALHVPFATLEEWPNDLARVTTAGFDLVALDPKPGAVDVAATRPPRPALLVGAEGPGLTPAAIAATERLGGRRVRIPINPDADSLNVSVATAIALHQTVAQASHL